MIYLVVGIDRQTLRPWHQNIRARDVKTARHVARARAHATGVDLLVAAVVGPAAAVV